LPHAETAARPLARDDDAEIALEEWVTLLDGRLNTTTESTVVKTRNHITAHLTQFGLLHVRLMPGDRFNKCFYARFYDPDPRAFWFSLALEFAERGWTSRSLEYVSNESWTQIAYCAKPAYARYAMEEAERAALVVTDFYGSKKQVTFRGPGFVSTVAEAILNG
jgi:hypothetical protein